MLYRAYEYPKRMCVAQNKHLILVTARAGGPGPDSCRHIITEVDQQSRRQLYFLRMEDPDGAKFRV